MNRSLERVVGYLANSDNIDAAPVAELQKLAAEHPYFPVAQLLLARKLRDVDPEAAYLSQLQRTALYFSNPYWLQYVLAGEQEHPELPTEEFKGTIAETDGKDGSNGAEHGSILDTAVAPGSASDETSENVTLTEDTREPAGALPEMLPVTKQETSAFSSNAAATTGPEIQADEEMTAMARDTGAEATHFVDTLDTTTAAEAQLPDRLHFPLAAEEEIVAQQEEMIGATPVDDSTTAFIEEAADLPPDDGPVEVKADDEHDRMFQNIKAMLDASSEEADADTRNAVIPIDPYYTIDYFASQGIKLELDQNPQDQLGQNLKKFTQWLRHMKKLGPEDATEAINRTESEADIQQIADLSNTVREVVTEAMALVLEKQGKNDKAIELYNKLSFLNPDKSAYFADKINKLKGS